MDTSGISATGSRAAPADGAPWSELWVCFARPDGDPPPHALVLSFMPPALEAAMEEREGSRMLSGRAVVQEIRAAARDEYVGLVARLGSTPMAGGRTLRETLANAGGYSRWWLLDVTEKDCVWDGDPLYTTMLRLKAIEAVREAHGIAGVRLHGGDPLLAGALGQRQAERPSFASVGRVILAGLAGRAAFLVRSLSIWRAVRRVPAPEAGVRDVLLQGYWDWSVRPDAGGTVRDRYFTDLPVRLAARGISVGWLASCESRVDAVPGAPSTRAIVEASRAHPDVTLLERFLTPADAVRAALDVRHAVRVTRFVLGRRFRERCRVGGRDLSALVARQLLRAAWTATVARLELVATATARACRRLEPAALLTFLELFLRSRAFYAGVRAGSPRTRVWAAQHAGYSSDKTMGVFDPEVEVRGRPDGCAVPAPDGLFVMGSLSKRVWEASGFEPDRVVVTGGLRYQSVRIAERAPREPGPVVSVLLLGGMNEAAEADVCEAIVAAASGLPSVRLAWRDHPAYRFSRLPAFKPFAGAIAVTDGSVDQDLDQADLVLFTHTGLAEEALLRGLPAWQWLWAGFNTSPFLDLGLIPSFTSVKALRRELEMFLANPGRYRPAPETQRRVLDECFGPDPSAASTRIADALEQMIRRSRAVPA